MTQADQQTVYDGGPNTFLEVLARLEPGDPERLRASAADIHRINLKNWLEVKSKLLERGFSIHSNVGQIEVKPGQLARSIARLIEQDLQRLISQPLHAAKPVRGRKKTDSTGRGAAA